MIFLLIRLFFLISFQSEGHRQILTRELEAVGLRLNKRPPQVYACLVENVTNTYNNNDSNQAF
jgi:ribosome-interacting GTPase 1